MSRPLAYWARLTKTGRASSLQDRGARPYWAHQRCGGTLCAGLARLAAAATGLLGARGWRRGRRRGRDPSWQPTA
jgi:hypothetical protein